MSLSATGNGIKYLLLKYSTEVTNFVDAQWRKQWAKPDYNIDKWTHVEWMDIISFILIPWIRTGLQNTYGYRNSHIC